MTLLGKLTSLYINLSEEQQVDYIIRSLPNLEYLNGLEVDRDEEEEEEEESSLELSMQKEEETPERYVGSGALPLKP